MFSRWLVERSQRDDTKMPERRSSLELHIRAATKNMSSMTHGRAGAMDSAKKKGHRSSRTRDAISRSERGE
jgi:hypothetical protein